MIYLQSLLHVLLIWQRRETKYLFALVSVHLNILLLTGLLSLYLFMLATRKFKSDLSPLFIARWKLPVTWSSLEMVWIRIWGRINKRDQDQVEQKKSAQVYSRLY